MDSNGQFFWVAALVAGLTCGAVGGFEASNSGGNFFNAFLKDFTIGFMLGGFSAIV